MFIAGITNKYFLRAISLKMCYLKAKNLEIVRSEKKKYLLL